MHYDFDTHTSKNNSKRVIEDKLIVKLLLFSSSYFLNFIAKLVLIISGIQQYILQKGAHYKREIIKKYITPNIDSISTNVIKSPIYYSIDRIR